MFDKLKGVEDRFQELERLLSDPKVLGDRDAYQKYICEHADISPVVVAFREFKRVDRELDDSLELLADDDPEMKKMAGEEVDHRADLYAVGMVLYEMLTGEMAVGRFPLPGESYHVRRRRPRRCLLDAVYGQPRFQERTPHHHGC